MANKQKVDHDEQYVTKVIKSALEKRGYLVEEKPGHIHGCDICAIKGEMTWVIEIKGEGSSRPMYNNFFLQVLGEILQRMDNPNVKYSIAFPDHEKYRRLWNELPKLAKERTKISAIFARERDQIDEVP